MAIRPDTNSKKAPPRPASPKGELEQYGVWVKAEPQDKAQANGPSKGPEVDFDLPDVDSSLPEESFLSEDEEKLLGSFDMDFDTAPDTESGTLPDIEDLPPLADSTDLSGGPTALRHVDVQELGAETIDISLEDLGQESGAATKLAPKTASGASKGIEDVSSEFLDSFDEEPSAANKSGGSGIDDVTAEFLDLEEAPAPAPTSPSDGTDFQTLDIDLQFDDTIPSLASGESDSSSSESTGFEEVSDFDDFLSDEPGTSQGNIPDSYASQSTSPPNAKRAQVAAFDDLAAVEKDLSERIDGVVSASAQGKSDLSTEILMKIADELSSIRGELVSLKGQLGALRTQPENAGQTGNAEEDAAQAAGGFFDDEEDETIALTGDELDNILNTADFTEEVAGMPVEENLESLETFAEEGEPGDISIIDESLLPESGDYSADIEPAIEEVRLGETVAVESPEPDSIEFEEISQLADAGAHPMTLPPDDTSYLEEPLMEGGAPLDDVPLVEPDLSEFEIEPDFDEGPVETDGELPSVDGMDNPDLALSIDIGEEYAGSALTDETSDLESIPEFEDTEFSEISLHEETSHEPEVEEFEDGLLQPPASHKAPPSQKPSSTSESEPAGPHPDHIATSLDDSLFVGADDGAPLEAEEDLVLEPAEEEYLPATDKPAPGSSELDLPLAADSPQEGDGGSDRLKTEIRSVLSYLDKLLDSLPEEKIEEFAKSEYFDTYKKLFEELGLV